MDTITGLREKPKKGQNEESYHMTCILKKLYPSVNWRVGGRLVTIDGESAEKIVGKRIFPDFLSTELKMIIEIDGDRANKPGGHFTSKEKAQDDICRKEILERLGYKVIAIPPYIQLDSLMVKHYFGIVYDGLLYPAATEHGFAHPEISLPASFCKLGLARFVTDMSKIPITVRQKIIDTLRQRVIIFENEGFSKEDALAKVLPPSIQYILEK